MTVVVSGGRIVSAEITSCQTKYPCSKVSSLPAQVITRQSASVNSISGATDSSRAYASAVAAALAKAQG
ncbi:MAG: FMN-binding protein [Dehalococcoidia bacterium]|nr:FMN-binding protein [Dehalococcoidia bacterium]